MASPLFPNFNRALQQHAREAFRATPLGQAVGLLNHARARGGMTPEIGRRFQRAIGQSANPDALRRILESTPLGSISANVERYARRGGSGWHGLLNMLGPVGELVSSLLRPQGRATTSNLGLELDAAAKLLEAFGYRVTPPGAARTGRGIEDQGFTREPPPTSRPPASRQGQRQEPNTRTIPGMPGRIPADDPVFTGDMIDVESSNVHSIGYIWNEDDKIRGTLKVRYLAKKPGGKRGGPGPLYYYYNVHPIVFMNFQDASSKGTFVWDRLRIRGSVSGSRFPYQLKGTGNSDYVPRRAALRGVGKNAQQLFVPRRMGSVTSTNQTVQHKGKYRPDQPHYYAVSDPNYHALRRIRSR